ncbi:hypothetical protein BDY19DRAFT_920565 [Irpex rosettiformis]|uniref:Uncharacterized protein n=1 Tax=Irpex rosettiformis TaxID=378272 RepID=A0ACB8UJ23_9APHY|nr:hypothetical protein BDY19DRAFT_920565 [Irpex rosettiformis]
MGQSTYQATKLSYSCHSDILISMVLEALLSLPLPFYVALVTPYVSCFMFHTSPGPVHWYSINTVANVTT